ncbi:uncharacterized protein LOC141832125 [Curcuma longa]|uniref:uncharacterized protein LOC141832125 n=1 Tax=Curcuma longa TaxID=136217 RepID=UPI003D9DDD3D
MGCYPPLGKMVTKAFDKYKGRKRRGIATTMVYSPPPSYSYTRSVAKHVTFSTDHAVVMPPDTIQMVPPVSKHHPGPAISPSPQAEMAQSNEQCRVRFAPEPTTQHGEIPDPPRRAPRSKQPRFSAEPDHQAAEAFPNPASRNEPPPTYAPSPLPRWEEGERRREYFGGEYHYYPTPVREGIYRIATDPNRLTTIFSEENPNACSIV